jgi:hypothetical protein
MNYNILGVIVGYLFFGLVISRMQRAFLRAAHGAALNQAAVFLVALWTATLVAYPIEVIAQMIIYNFGPAYVCFWWFRRRAVPVRRSALHGFRPVKHYIVAPPVRLKAEES